MKLSFYTAFIALFFLLIFSCAKQGSPTGGPKDELAPILVVTKPLHKSTNFNKKEIKISFDEFVVLKDLTQQLIVSPPLKTPAVITPQSTASKQIKIKLLDTLLPNTTYTFNFGSAIQDNNEGNIIEDFKYIFSTGKYIDSLTSTGSVVNALEGNLKKNVNILLYEYDSTFTDSIVFKQKPKYVARTTDSIHFQFTNIKEGKYMMLAIDEESTDYIFNPRSDKIAFLTDTIQLPRDSILNKNLVLFKEKTDFKFKKAREVSVGKIVFGYTGKQENLKIRLLSKVPENFKSAEQFEQEKDTLNYWHTPVEGLDSLNFIISHQEFIDTLTVKLRKKKLDSLTIASNIKGILKPLDTFLINTNNPIQEIDKTKFSFLSDSIPVNYELKKHGERSLALLFKKEQNKNYKFLILPDAIYDLYKTSNDSLAYSFKTKSHEDYGSINLKIQKNTKAPLIIELLLKDKVIRRVYTKDNKNNISFNLLEPNTYKIRATVDKNKNNIWDTGNFLKRISPEQIIYLDKELELRPNWSLNETISID